jgi:signal transduction histidine kinase/ligand-binding sensor domain-containing protein
MVRQRRPSIALGLLLACCPCASALDPSLAISQYAHAAWRIRDSFSKGRINAIGQTPDGYLWLGTEFGLLRFDGVRNVPLQSPEGEHLPGGIIRSLLGARDGDLWIGTDEGLADWKAGRLTQYPELAGQSVNSLLEDREGTVWAAGTASSTARLCAIQRGSARCYGKDGSLGRGVISLYEDSAGNLWVAGESRLWRWKAGPSEPHPLADSIASSQSLMEGDDGALLIAMQSGIRQLVNGEVEARPLPGAGQFKEGKLLRDRDGGLWIGTSDRGLLHSHQGRTDVFAESDGLTGDDTLSLFEDREGNIWVATQNGLDHFRNFAVPTVSASQGLSNSHVLSVLAARDGSVWLGTPDGLNRWNNGQITIYLKQRAPPASGGATKEKALDGVAAPGGFGVRRITDSGLPDDFVESLFQDERGRIWVSTDLGVAYFENGRFVPVGSLPAGRIYSIAEDRAGDLWLSYQEEGLLHLQGGSVVEKIPWARLGGKDWAPVLVADPAQGGLWLGFFEGGVAYFKDGQVRASFKGADGLGEGRVGGLQADRDGTLWAATGGGLSRVKNGRVATLSSKNGLPCDTAHWVMEDDAHSFWLYMACGLVRVARSELEAWAANGVDKDPKGAIQATVWDILDGVRTLARTGGYSPRVAKSTDGKLWFLPLDGVSIVDPRHLPFSNLPPPIYVEEIAADRKTYWQNSAGEASSHLRLPPLTRDLEIDYTALSLVAPEKIRFRVKLEGRDPDWKDVGNERKAFYNDLPPRNYRFRVAAANNSGVWNEAGAFLDFSVAPAYYQTIWFRLSVVAAFLALLWALYRLRLHQVAREFNARLEERVNERTRIARELHDTLLQSFQGVLMKFSAVKYVIPARPDEAVETLERAIDQARAAITEGRDAVEGLRSSTALTNDLARAVATFVEGLAANHNGANCPEFLVRVEGKSRDLPALVRDEVYRIACEALRNAFRHAQAKRIEAEIRYDPREFQLRVVDNGKGIDPEVLSAGGRVGHHGLPGLDERAQVAGGKLSVWSRVDSGTEIELTIPAHLAYTKSPAARRSIFAGRGMR